MARRFNTRTTIFSHGGRLLQVENALELVDQASACLGIIATDGILLAAEHCNINKLLESTEKIHLVNEYMACSATGIESDANVLIKRLREIAQSHLLLYGESIPCEQLVTGLCDIKHAYTQFGGKRPFGVSILYMGWDKHYGYQLYQSNPSGNYTGWKATCIGNKSAAAVDALEQEYKINKTNLVQAKALAIKVLSKILDVNKLTPENVEMATLKHGNGKTKIKTLSDVEVRNLITRFEKSCKTAKKQLKS